ncbi:substrate-binding periplasmic protein [Pseudoalteromonas sp.]|uniref:substrate-binding periplasmic protein n=1 Tax=Pseudoalteromonas sp. TaxID=53249 RepID=UPI003568545F
MGYRTSARLPLIDAMPSDNGLYKAIFKRAAESINCTLKVKRAPKKRIIKLLKEGHVDFYPGFGFSKERSNDVYFFENGLTSHSVILTHKDIPSIASLNDLNNKVLLKPYGGRKLEVEQQDILVRYGQDLSISDAVKVLEKKQADFFIYNKASITYYLVNNPKAQVKIHECCFDAKPMYLGFSKKSKHFNAITNENYQADKALSFDNLPYKIDEHSKASAFAKAINALSESGEIEILEKRFYSAALDSEHMASSDISVTKH